ESRRCTSRVSVVRNAASSQNRRTKRSRLRNKVSGMKDKGKNGKTEKVRDSGSPPIIKQNRRAYIARRIWTASAERLRRGLLEELLDLVLPGLGLRAVLGTAFDRQLLELAQQFLLAFGQRDRRFDHDMTEQVARIARAHALHALAAQAEGSRSEERRAGARAI